jgi:hypothetical protein
MKNIVFILLLSVSLYAQVKTEQLDKIASLTWKYEITDTMFTFDVRGIVNYQNTHIVFSDLYSKKIYKFEMKTKKFIQLSRNGSGPGEYKFPTLLSMYGKNIYFTDYVTGAVQAIDINGKYVLKVDLKTRVGFYNPVAMLDNKRAFIGQNSSSPFWLFDSDSKGHFKEEKCFNKFPLVMVGGDVVIHNGTVYYINPLEFNIYCLNTNNSAEKTIELKGLDKTFNWKPYYSNIITENEYNDINEYKWVLKPVKLFKIIKSGKMFIGLSCYNTKKKSYSLAIFNEQGSCLKNIELGSLALFDVENDVFKLYKAEDRVLKGFYFYSINKNLLNELK